MALFKHSEPTTTPDSAPEADRLPAPPEPKNGLRDFWQHWDYILGLVPELAEFGVPVLDAVGLTLNESILAEQDVSPELRAGDPVIERGTRVTARMVGLLAGLGIRKVMARPNPRVLVIAVSAPAVPASFLVAAEAQSTGAQTYRLEYVYDTASQTASSILEQLVRADLVITVGGLGEAGLDLRDVADRLGPHDFAPVAIDPGRDHGFILAEGSVPLIALPADPYACFVLTKLLVEPVIAKQMGADKDPELFSAYLAQPLRITPGILTCVPATVKDARMTIAGRPSGLRGLDVIYRANALALLTGDGLVDVDSEAIFLPLKA